MKLRRRDRSFAGDGRPAIKTREPRGELHRVQAQAGDDRCRGRRLRTVVLSVVSACATIAGLTIIAGPATATTAPATTPGPGIGGTVVISNEDGELWTCNFNPYNTNDNFLSAGTIYEPLVFVNALQSGRATPWLASSYAWSDGDKVLTFTIRNGVKWTDGVPLTAADVVFTFQLLKRFPAMDLNSVWSVLSGVTQKGTDQVVLTFKAPGVAYFFYVADQVFIVPQHVWSSVRNPLTYEDGKPVGTGPFLMNRCTPENVSYVRNPAYWQKGLPRIAKVDYPAFTSNNPANEELASGEANWGNQFIPSIQSYYVNRNPHYYHYWFPPTSNLSLIFNLTESPLNDVAVRRAFAFAIDRNRVSQIGEYGYQPAANQSGVVTPTYASWLDKALLAKYGYTYDPKKAIAILESDGYKRGSNGIFEKNGHRLSFSVINIGGFSDWVASMNIIAQELQAVGIQLTPENLSDSTFENDLYNGRYQLAYYNQAPGPTPYYELRQWLFSANTAPIGQSATTNWERYVNPATDALINAYGATSNVAKQHEIIDSLENVMLSQVPIVPVDELVDWYEYDTQHIGGWPTQNNAFAQPDPFATPDIEVVLLHLYQT